MLRVYHQGIPVYGILFFEVTLIDHCDSAVFTVLSDFYPDDISYILDSPAFYHYFDLDQVSTSTDNAVGYECPQIVLRMEILNPSTGLTTWGTEFADELGFITMDWDAQGKSITIETNDPSLFGSYILTIKVGMIYYDK